MMTIEQIRNELADCKKTDRHVIGVNGKRYFVFGHTADCLLVERVENGRRMPLYAMPYLEVASIEGMIVETAEKGSGDGMNWTKVNDRRWKTDCGCRITTGGPDGSEYYIPRNHLGCRIGGLQTSFIRAQQIVETYIQQRTDAGLYPYNH